MNRKNTIIIGVLINAGLLAILFIAAVTNEERSVPPTPIVRETPPTFPPFEEILPLPEPIAMKESEPLLHQLPALVTDIVPPPPPLLPSPYQEVVVKKGDTLDKMAKDYGVSIDEVIKINQLPSSFLKVGQVLKLPKGKALKEESGPEYYTVKVGDNVWGIAHKHKMKPEELLKLNALNEEKARKLKAGDRLRIR